MKKQPKAMITILVITALLMLICPPSSCLSESYGVSYQLRDQHGSTSYRLNVVVPQSLYEYYAGKNHHLVTENDFAKFITPHSLQPIADSLLEIYADREDFINGALMIVHQIPYQATSPPRYPVETVVKNEGDCDLLSYVLASILKGGGLDVVLLYYESDSHMNVGINMQSAPRDSRGEVYYVTHDGKRYYTTECTGSDWQTGWRVGECPEELKNASVQIVTLENPEQNVAGQVSASYSILTPTTLMLRASTSWMIQGSTTTIEGQLSPHLQNKNITVYVRTSNSPWIVLNTLATDSEGKFSFSWNINTSGTCYIRANWSGDEGFAAADSPVLTITILSTLFILFLTIILVIVSIGVITYLISRQPKQTAIEPQPPKLRLD